MKLWKVALGAGLLSSLVTGCVKESANQKRPKFVERLPRVEVVQPVPKRIARRLETSATVEALKKVDVSARVPGVVIDLADRMDIGRSVKKDEVLLRLDVPDLAAERDVKQAMEEQAKKQETLAAVALKVAKHEVEESLADEKRYTADVSYNRLRLARIKELVRQRAQDVQLEQEAARQSEVADATLASNRVATTKRQAKVEQAVADLELARQRVKTAAAEVAKLDRTIAFASVTAPFDGMVTRRWVDPGAVIKDPGAVLLTVMQMDRVRVLIDVPQRDVSLLNSREQNPNKDGRGDPVFLRMAALREPVQGTITRVARTLDPVTRTMRAEIELDNKDLQLQPGMYGSASVLVEDRSNVLSLPASALLRRGEGLVEVYQVVNLQGEGDERRGVLKRVPVELGIDDGKEVEIRGGLSRDDWVVLRAGGVMRPDETVLAIADRDSLTEK